MRNEVGRIAKKHVDLPAQQRRCHLPAAAKRNMHRIETRAGHNSAAARWAIEPAPLEP